MQNVIRHWETLRRFGAKAGPYLMLEIALPGGTLLALLLFLVQRRKLFAAVSIPGSAADATTWGSGCHSDPIPGSGRLRSRW
jgi:hypothetical protein